MSLEHGRLDDIERTDFRPVVISPRGLIDDRNREVVETGDTYGRAEADQRVLRRYPCDLFR